MSAPAKEKTPEQLAAEKRRAEQQKINQTLRNHIKVQKIPVGKRTDDDKRKFPDEPAFSSPQGAARLIPAAVDTQLQEALAAVKALSGTEGKINLLKEEVERYRIVFAAAVLGAAKIPEYKAVGKARNKIGTLTGKLSTAITGLATALEASSTMMEVHLEALAKLTDIKAAKDEAKKQQQQSGGSSRRKASAAD